MAGETLSSGGIFLSHCHEDNETVAELAKALAGRGHTVYVDIDSLRGGDTLTRTIARFINAASKVVVVLSKAAIGKRWVQTEIEWTLTREINEQLDLMVPYCLDPEALDWFRKDIRLGCKLSVNDFGRPRARAIQDLLKALPSPRKGPVGPEVDVRLSEEEEEALAVVDRLAQSLVLHQEGRDEEALALAELAAQEARETGLDPELSRALEVEKRILESQGRTMEAETLLEFSPAPCAFVLEVLSGERVGKRHPLAEGKEYVLGRGEGCEIRILGGAVSGKHCKVSVREGAVSAEDLKSRNGTFVDERQISAPTELALESILRLGDVSLRLTEEKKEARKSEDLVSGTYRRAKPSGVPAKGQCAVCKKPLRREEFLKHDALFKKHDDPSKSETHYCLECFVESPTGVFPEIGGFRLFKRLGEGGMGEVYEAVQKSMVRSVAFKVLKTIDDPDPTVLKRFFREARVGARLNHANVVQFIDAGQVGPKCFIAMEFVEGETLAQRLEEQGKLPIKEAVRVAYYVTKALAHAAEHGIVHRDIKPGNVLVRYDGTVKLADFGLAKNFQEAGLSCLTAQGTGLGTLYYMPPEQIDDAAHTDSRGDVYSLGATLYESLTGEKPFTGTSADEILKKIRTRVPPSPGELEPRVPAPVSRIVEKAMAKRPEDRHASPGDLMNALGKAYVALKKSGS
ncbi:MAG: protein kinase [Planctomycetes bacterium]|nr:protein kinase [Planctomycetota bacterium]